MKLFLIVVVIFVSVFANAKVGGGGNVGNGGHPIALDFLQSANKVVTDVNRDAHLFPELQGINFQKILKEVKVVVTDEDLLVEIEGKKQASTAMNFPDTNTVLINRSLWQQIPNRAQKLSLSFHEILGLVGLEKSGDYRISSRYQDKNLQNTELLVTSSPLPLIPGRSMSCLSVKTAPEGSSPVLDIHESYFSIPKLHIYRSNTTKELVITQIRVTAVISAGSKGRSILVRSFAGDALSALSSKWWNSPSRNTVIPASPKGDEVMFSTDCPLKVGGIADDLPFAGLADIDVYGFEVDLKTGEETPVKLNRVITLESFRF